MINRRVFLKQTLLTSAGLLFAEQLLADPYIPFSSPMTGKPVRIKGTILNNGTPLSKVSVSDGIQVIQTDQDGNFELVSNNNQPFVFYSIPSGYEVPKSGLNMASFFKAIQPDEKSEMKVKWDLNKLNYNDSSHGFLVLADPQTLDQEDMNRFHQETIPDIEGTLQQKSELEFFSAACGDIMFDHLEFFPQYKEGIGRLGIPGFQVVGNHDVDMMMKTDQTSVKTFMSHFGPNYYSFNRGEIHYVVLDDIFWYGQGYMGYLDQTQLNWLQNDLSFLEEGQKVVVFTHIPVFNHQFKRNGESKPSVRSVIVNRELLYDILKPFDTHIIAGHTHMSEHLKEHGAHIHVCGATCGAWWTGDICYDGTPNGYGVYEVNGSNLKWKYKSTGKPADHQMRIYQPGADPKFPDELVVNIWDANEAWKINWYENGNKKGQMTRRTSKDPLSVKQHSGSEKPQKHSWVEPNITSHLYYAPVSTETKEIVIEAVNPWGQKFVEKQSL